jgi:predicted DNA-binding transcriptional regulator AlpA
MTMEYGFTLKYQLAAEDREHDGIVERLGQAGCDDALVGIGLPGRLALEFAREADNARDAVFTALADVKRAVPSAHLIEAAPDLVGLTDIAELVGVSRQNMRKLMLTYADSFPAPVHAGSPSIWHLTEVLNWLETRGGYDLDPALREVARVAMEVNLVKEARHLSPEVSRSLERLIA